MDLETEKQCTLTLRQERQQKKKDQDGWLGYKITDKTNLNTFIFDFKIDLEGYILKQLEALKTLKDCILFYEKFEFWGNNLKRQIEECGLRTT
jgi:hypothetical protein